jgi:hypothetical protein
LYRYLLIFARFITGNNHIFITCDSSDWQTGTVLSFGPTWATARPVAFDSTQLKDAQLHYPTHEKELLAIIRTLSKWRTDLLGSLIIIYTDHRTLENFENQKDLSRCQARWMEYLSQYDHKIIYIKGEDNTVTDALSRLPNDVDKQPIPPVAAMLSIHTDSSLLNDIIARYKSDPFCKKLSDAKKEHQWH